jgi:predicted enzyme related to lactoylglutathione lyase
VAARFTELVVDAADPERLATFWQQVLGWSRVGVEGQEIEIGDASGALPTIVFDHVDDAKTVKNRVHIDVNPVGCEQAEELERLLALGATRADVGQTGEESWIVLADPEGNEFCLLAGRRD